MAVAQPLIDAAGVAHEPATSNVRIVSLVPSITECLCDLELEEQVVGRTGFCIHPRETVAKIPKVGGTKDVDLDKVRALEPTHVVLNIDENRRETAAALREFVPHLVVTHPLSPRDNFELYSLLGGVFGRVQQAARLSQALRTELDGVNEVSTTRRVLYLIWRKPWMTISRDTYISRMLDLVNWETFPPTAEQRYPELELADARGHIDLALLSSEPYPFRARHIDMVREAVGAEVGVHLVEGDMLSWYGSRAIAGVAYLRRLAARLGESATTTIDQ